MHARAGGAVHDDRGAEAPLGQLDRLNYTISIAHSINIINNNIIVCRSSNITVLVLVLVLVLVVVVVAVAVAVVVVVVVVVLCVGVS